ncbi:TPA: hypothetical protein EYO63_27435 [Candidatus Poribacteria bacterium]|nr:hypothetical protein [Candidatus Poribacteria bacterium]
MNKRGIAITDAMLSDGNSVAKKAVFGNAIERSRPTMPISMISSSTATWRLGVIAEVSCIPALVESRAHKAFFRCSTRDLMVSCAGRLFKVEDESANP